MPDPVSSYATFQCSYLGADVETATIPADAMAAILGTNPTRIQISVGRLAGYPLAGDPLEWTTNLVVGHTHLGYTTVEAAAAK